MSTNKGQMFSYKMKLCPSHVLSWDQREKWRNSDAKRPHELGVSGSLRSTPSSNFPFINLAHVLVCAPFTLCNYGAIYLTSL